MPVELLIMHFIEFCIQLFQGSFQSLVKKSGVDFLRQRITIFFSRVCIWMRCIHFFLCTMMHSTKKWHLRNKIFSNFDLLSRCRHMVAFNDVFFFCFSFV